MMEKYKINTAAADFKSTTKDVAALIKEYTGAEKKSGATLTEQEVNILFDALTQKNSVKSFDEYFASGRAAREEVEKAKKAKKDQNLAAQMAILEQLKAAQEAEMAAKRAAKAAAEGKTEEATAEKKEEKKPAEVKKEAQRAEPKKEESKKEAPKAEPKKEAQKTEPKREHKPSDPKPFEARKKEERPAGAAPNRGPAERRTVDTRFSNVDMEKYPHHRGRYD